VTASPARGRFDPRGEVDLALDREAAARLVDRLRAGRGRLPLEAGRDPAPYRTFLQGISVAATPGRRVTLRLDDAEETLAITGDPEYLKVLAENIAELAAPGDRATHLHVDYFPDHFYLEQGSAPTTVHLLPPSADQ